LLWRIGLELQHDILAVALDILKKGIVNANRVRLRELAAPELLDVVAAHYRSRETFRHVRRLALTLAYRAKIIFFSPPSL
jgi:hypothetical protein